MRHNPVYELTDPEVIARVIRENPWATIVSNASTGLVASHYPVLLEGEGDALSVVSHMGRPDEELHELGAHEMLVIVQGPHGYVSPAWYEPGPAVPTWNFVTVHLSGVPEILSDDENMAVLERLVERSENRMSHPRLLHDSPAQSEYSRRLMRGTVGFRLRAEKLVAKVKMSQSRPADTVRRITEELAGDGPYASEALAREMRDANPGV
ncbi:negative transcriptional regulator, PaiB family [Paramicrobacterium humi]|uniref:Negative transcriptional regulator, PaiB family n=1 Tax=Paramicrobacterium humi TaxID=640635 RepID=A0A1H4IUJ3_9MICO|nr:FMN-binding negative transcriptional regulator [Microbacterium humi]SEB37729.1 negative transcriptional regulator, PaiB family [Microbacterium humi]